MQNLARTESAALKSAADELIRAYQATPSLASAMHEALRHLRHGNAMMAQATLQDALERNRL